MTDIFLSYKKEDVDLARPFAAALEAQGFSVWWDRKIAPGEQWAEVIEKAIESAGAVVVLWTHRSVESKWVNKEARKGEMRGNLIPALLEDASVPFEFEHVQAANLIGWDYTSQDSHFEALVRECRSVLGGRKSRGVAIPADPPVVLPAPSPAARGLAALSTGKFVGLVAASVVPLVGVLALSFVPINAGQIWLRDVATTHIVMTVAASGGAGQLVTEQLKVKSVIVTDAASLFIPATAQGPGRDVQSDLLMLELRGPDDGAIGVNGMRIEPGGKLQFEPGGMPGEIRMTVSELTGDLTMSVSGTVDVLAGDEETTTLDFGPGAAISVSPGSGTLTLEVAFTDSIRGVSCGACPPLRILENVEVNQIVLSRLEQDVNLNRTALKRIPTVRSGAFGIGSDSTRLNDGDDLRFETFRGTVRSVDVSDAPFTLDADGEAVTGAVLGGASVMPLRFGALGRLFQMLLGAMILIELGVLTILRRRRG